MFVPCTVSIVKKYFKSYDLPCGHLEQVTLRGWAVATRNVGWGRTILLDDGFDTIVCVVKDGKKGNKPVEVVVEEDFDRYDIIEFRDDFEGVREGDFIEISGQVTEFMFEAQLKVDSMKKLNWAEEPAWWLEVSQYWRSLSFRRRGKPLFCALSSAMVVWMMKVVLCILLVERVTPASTEMTRSLSTVEVCPCYCHTGNDAVHAVSSLTSARGMTGSSEESHCKVPSGVRWSPQFARAVLIAKQICMFCGREEASRILATRQANQFISQKCFAFCALAAALDDPPSSTFHEEQALRQLDHSAIIPDHMQL